MKEKKKVLYNIFGVIEFRVGSRILFMLTLGLMLQIAVAQQFMPSSAIPPKYVPDTRIDNMGYWRRMAELGLVSVQPPKHVPDALPRSSKLSAPGIATYDSPDIPVTETTSLQSENSIFVDPDDGFRLINSNNSHPAPYSGAQYGADALQSADGGSNWEGTVLGVGGYNFGDPATAISRTGRMYVGCIFSGGGQGISYSDDNGLTWKKRGVASAPGGFGSILDKNHLWIDNSLSSPFLGNMYNGWTVIGGSTGSGHLQVSPSMDGGLAWQNAVTISDAVAAGSHNQGINIQTGPLGEVYAVWAIYDSWPSDEKALGFARSSDGGHTWRPSKRIINNINGIRTRGVNKLMRVNSFPSMAVDLSNGPDRGSIYVVWTNNGEPGINHGADVDIFLMKSKDLGETWSAPLKINQDAPNRGKEHYFPWITCDPDNGNLAVVFYDDRNVPDDMCETWVAVSKNGGLTWQDFRVSDVAFTPLPLTGLSDNYFGDYLGITSKAGMVYPCWTDNRTGEAMGYVSPFRIGPPPGQAYIDYYTHIINDTLTGNANAKAEYGETFSFSLNMRNIGDQPDSLVSVTLSCDSPFVQILNSSQSFGNFDIGQIKNIPLAFQVSLSELIPDKAEFVFTLTATDKYDSVYQSSMVVVAHAPHLSIGPLLVIDTAGNGNNQPDPGESVTLASVLTNTGDYVVPSAISKLSTPQAFCHIVNAIALSAQIAPGQCDTVRWHADFDAGTAAGSLAGFIDSLSYSGQQERRLFLKKIGVLTEDWESGDLSKMAWRSSGNKSWNINNFMVYEGTYSLRSGYIKSLDTSALYIVLNLTADDSISFYRKVSSELSFDFLNFYIDNMKVGQWSGEKDWARVSFPIPAGMHTLKWEYTKDQGLSVGYDAAWIDFIEFPVQQQTVTDAGPDARVCEGNTFQPEAIATNYQSLLWTTSGSGFFNDSGISNPVYYPGPSDIEAGTVQLIITLKGYSYGETVKDTLLLTFVPKPTLNAGADTYTCTGELFMPSPSASNYISTRWSTSGDGTFSNTDTLFTAYSPGPDDIQNGLTKLILKIIPDAACQQLYDSLLLNIYHGFSAALSGDTTICRGDTALLKISFTGQGPWRIYLSDGSALSLQKQLITIPVAPAITTEYRIDSIVNGAGCISRLPLTANVSVLQPPVIELLGPVESCQGHQVILQANADSVAGYLWTPGEATQSFIRATISGAIGEYRKYKVEVRGNNGCSISDSIQVKIVTDCDDRKAGDMDVRYYPNPTNGDFTLLLSSGTYEIAEVNISSMDNKQVFSLEKVQVYGVLSIPVNLKSFASGTYILAVKCRSGQLKDKLVIKK